MPAQFGTNVWGVYLMDIDTQSICAYEFLPGERVLRFVAARNFRSDRKLGNWNTQPDPAEIAKLLDVQQGGVRGAPPPAPVAPQNAMPTDRP